MAQGAERQILKFILVSRSPEMAFLDSSYLFCKAHIAVLFIEKIPFIGFRLVTGTSSM